jgi:hypothetical protein
MKIGAHNIHTGMMIELVMRQKHMPRVRLAAMIDRIPLSVKQYTKKSSIQTTVLIELCYALQHNFFSDLADKLPAHLTKNQPNADKILAEKDALIAQLQEENKVLKIRNEMLLEIQRGKI